MKLFTIATTIAFAASIAATNIASAETWKLAAQHGTDSVEGMAITKFSELTKEYTGGDLEIQVFPNEQLGKIGTVIDQVSADVIQIAPTSATFLSKWVPAISYISAPFIFKDYDHWVRFMDSDLVEGWISEAEEKGNIKVLGDIAAWPRSSYRVLLSDKPVSGLEDLQGLRVRQFSNELIVDAWTHLGTEVRVLGSSEVYDAINRKIVSAATSPLAEVLSSKNYEVAPYVMRTNEYPQGLAFLMSREAFEGLSSENQEALEKAFADAAQYVRDLLASNDQATISELSNLGVTYTEVPLGDIYERMATFYQGRDDKGELPDGFLAVVEQTK